MISDGSLSEENTISGFGSIVLATALVNSYAAGAVVSVQDRQMMDANGVVVDEGATGVAPGGTAAGDGSLPRSVTQDHKLHLISNETKATTKATSVRATSVPPGGGVNADDGKLPPVVTQDVEFEGRNGAEGTTAAGSDGKLPPVVMQDEKLHLVHSSDILRAEATTKTTTTVTMQATFTDLVIDFKIVNVLFSVLTSVDKAKLQSSTAKYAAQTAGVPLTNVEVVLVGGSTGIQVTATINIPPDYNAFLVKSNIEGSQGGAMLSSVVEGVQQYLEQANAAALVGAVGTDGLTIEGTSSKKA